MLLYSEIICQLLNFIYTWRSDCYCCGVVTVWSTVVMSVWSAFTGYQCNPSRVHCMSFSLTKLEHDFIESNSTILVIHAVLVKSTSTHVQCRLTSVMTKLLRSTSVVSAYHCLSMWWGFLTQLPWRRSRHSLSVLPEWYGCASIIHMLEYAVDCFMVPWCDERTDPLDDCVHRALTYCYSCWWNMLCTVLCGK